MTRHAVVLSLVGVPQCSPQSPIISDWAAEGIDGRTPAPIDNVAKYHSPPATVSYEVDTAGAYPVWSNTTRRTNRNVINRGQGLSTRLAPLAAPLRLGRTGS